MWQLFSYDLEMNYADKERLENISYSDVMSNYAHVLSEFLKA